MRSRAAIYVLIVLIGLTAIAFFSFRKRPLISPHDSPEQIVDKSIHAVAGDKPDRFFRGRIYYDSELYPVGFPARFESVEEGFIDPEFLYRKWQPANEPKFGDPEIYIVNGDQDYVKLFGLPSQTKTIDNNDTSNFYRSQLLQVFVLLDLKEDKPKLTRIGNRRENDRDFVVVEATYDDGSKTEFVIDERSGLVLRMKGLNKTKRFGTRMTEVLFEDYQDVNGGKLPTKITRFMEGKIVAITRITRFDFDTPIDENAFAIPDR